MDSVLGAAHAVVVSDEIGCCCSLQLLRWSVARCVRVSSVMCAKLGLVYCRVRLPCTDGDVLTFFCPQAVGVLDTSYNIRFVLLCVVSGVFRGCGAFSGYSSDSFGPCSRSPDILTCCVSTWFHVAWWIIRFAFHHEKNDGKELRMLFGVSGGMHAFVC